jgi:peptide deformylase
LPIRVYGDPVLNTVTTDVENIDATIAALAESMIETMYDAPGVGLAANQVGVQKRLFVYDEGEGDGAFVVSIPPSWRPTVSGPSTKDASRCPG